MRCHARQATVANKWMCKKRLGEPCTNSITNLPETTLLNRDGGSNQKVERPN